MQNGREVSPSKSDGEISPMELESLAANGDLNSNSNKGRGGLDMLAASTVPANPIDTLMMMLKLYFELYPKAMIGGSTLLVGLLLYSWSPWQAWGSGGGLGKNAARNHMTHDYTALQDNFNFQTAQIDHWCLFGGDDRCYCEDPTEGVSRAEVPGWSQAHRRNKKLVESASSNADVVFFGDQNIQSWDGRWLDRPAPEGRQINKLFNKTFGADSETSAFNGVALGIYGDRINNILWRIQHGELPYSLNAKIFWLVMGTNDLALGMCSEEVVTLGIMRIAEEVHHRFPDAIVVIQGILPRSNHKDGSLTGKDSKMKRKSISHAGGADVNQYVPMNPGGRKTLRNRNLEKGQQSSQQQRRQLQDLTTPGVAAGTETTETKEAETEEGESSSSSAASSSASVSVSAGAGSPHVTFDKKGDMITMDNKGKVIARASDHRSPQPYYDYYLWPSIQAINKELEGFCSKHNHFVYFDADDLVLGSIGNDHYRAAHKTIISELMPNYVHLSYMGHEVVMGVIVDEIKRIIYDDDERNDIEKRTGKGGRNKRQ